MVLTGLLMLGAAVNAVAQPVRQVLVLQSVNRGNLTIDEFTGNFRVELDTRADKPVNVFQVVVGATGFVSAPEQATVGYIQSAFIDRPQPNLIITVGGPAAVFARKYRQQLFPDTPLLFAAVDQRYLGNAPLGDNETAVVADNDFSRGIDTVLQLLPQTRQVFMVMGSGPIGQFWHRELESQFRRFHDRLTFVWFDDLSLPEILRRCATLPDNSAIFYVTFGTDAAGAAYADARVFADLRTAANAPLFSSHSVYLGAGIIGGPLLSIDTLSRDTADAADRLLDGRHREASTSRHNGQVNRYSTGASCNGGDPRQPVAAGQHRALSRAEPVAAIPGHGAQRRRRARSPVAPDHRTPSSTPRPPRAEIESRNNLALAADASRRLTMSALTSSIAHELGQPLSSMIHNAQAGRMMITVDRATPDTIGEILADIESEGVQATQIIDRHRTMLRSHQLETKPIDVHVVIHDSLALVAHDLRTRQIEATVNLSSRPCIITGDAVLLQQVMVNLLLNAMEAMTETPPARRRVTISTDVRAADVDVSVRDAGSGVPAQMNGVLFTPFVTTKAHGLGIGLAIARTIVDAHGGTLGAHNNPEGGATFTLTLRRTETPESLSVPPAAVA